MVGGRRGVGIVSSAVSLTWRPGLAMTAGMGPFLAALAGGGLLNVVAGRPGVVVPHCYRGAHPLEHALNPKLTAVLATVRCVFILAFDFALPAVKACNRCTQTRIILNAVS